MGRQYSHLTEDDRIEIHIFLKENRSLKEMASLLGRNISTISREIKRNKEPKGYKPRQAQEKAQCRKDKARYKKADGKMIAFIKERLLEDWSPEQVSGYLKKKFSKSMSPEWIYQFIYKDKKEGGCLHKRLRINDGRKYRRRYGKKSKRGIIPGRIDIDERSSVIENRTRFGDWEADLVSGKRHKGFLITLVERKFNFTLIDYVKQKTAINVATIIKKMVSEYAHLPVKSITFDNGKEFCEHQDIAKELNCQTFFAHPYHAWERGTNENTNGLIRQYFPKKISFENLTKKEIAFVQDRLNNRPRKKLDFSTPNEKVKHYKPVALRT